MCKFKINVIYTKLFGQRIETATNYKVTICQLKVCLKYIYMGQNYQDGKYALSVSFFVQFSW